MDMVIPGSIDMDKVKFEVQGEEDRKHNFSLLNEAFSKNGITRVWTVSLVVEERYNFFSFFCYVNVPNLSIMRGESQEYVFKRS